MTFDWRSRHPGYKVITPFFAAPKRNRTNAERIDEQPHKNLTFPEQLVGTDPRFYDEVGGMILHHLDRDNEFVKNSRSRQQAIVYCARTSIARLKIEDSDLKNR